MKIKNPSQIEFICTKCNTTEKIPKDIVEMLDGYNQIGVDIDMPPRFDCENCDGKMIPKFYIGVNGKKYFFDDYKNKLY